MMRAFTFTTARDVADAVAVAGSGPSDPAGSGPAYLAGGTTLVDLMKLDVLTPDQVVDINALPLRGIHAEPAGLVVGALRRMSEVAAHPAVAGDYPLVAQALLASASPQVRNMASIGGNLLQPPRCGYYRDVSTKCNRRVPGSGCSAGGGQNRGHAILGLGGSCVAVHPSDLAVALTALDATVRLRDRSGARELPLAEFYRLPGDTPQIDTELRPGELVTAVVLPRLAWARRSTYVKISDRHSQDFALTSAAVAADVHRGKVRDVRIAVGGVAPKPWRLPLVEQALRGQPMSRDSFQAAAALAVEGAHPLRHNQFKVALVQRTIIHALSTLAG